MNKQSLVLTFGLALGLACGAARATDVTTYTCQRIFEAIRVIDGGHPIYDVEVPIPDLDKLLPEQLPAFGKNPPTIKNLVRQNLLFNPLLVHGVHWALTGRSEKSNAVDLLKQIPPNTKFNYVIHGKGKGRGEGIVIGRIGTRFPWLDDKLSKHLLLSNMHPDVRYSGEFWVDENGVIHFSNNSGTYQPDGKYIKNGAVEKVLREIFPGKEFKFEGTAVDPMAIKKAEQKKASKIAKVKDLVRTISHLDIAFPVQKYYSKVILKTAQNKRVIRVPISQLNNVIRMDNVKKRENDERAGRIKDSMGEIAKAGGLTQQLQKQLFTEGEPISVIRDNNGRYVAFDGNGRLQSLEMVYGKNSNLPVEVVYYENPDKAATNFMTWVRGWRKLENKEPAQSAR